MTASSSGSLHLLVHAPQRGDNMASEMGRADYSYYFVMRHFLPVLERLGTVVEVADPATQADPLYERIRAEGGDAVLLLFMPPHRVPAGLTCPTVPVFAWEYSTIPNEAWGGDPRQNWAAVLREARGAITHSNFARDAAHAALGRDFPLCSLPAPLWDGYRVADGRAPMAQKTSWDLTINGVVLDSRAIGFDRGFDAASPAFTLQETTVQLGGTVYTSVFNPNDQRKNWHDLLTAFVWALRDEPQATLLLKLVHHDAAFACGMVLHEMRKLAPYRCRVVAMHGYLDDASYARMVQSTSYVVNSALGEGQCLPLMEFMSAGKPALAPAHTAMADYVTERNSFVVSSSREWTHWPHDPRMVMRCHRHRIDWASLRDAYLESWHVAQHEPQRYAAMSQRAARALRHHCAADLITVELWRFLLKLGLSPVTPSLRMRASTRLTQLLRAFREE
ncbi:hypothetical protein [Niveibacterium sp.]|uniref:hypothetical protein n=1 Tax=Niveibacterium sp. TaxID=2017444 RepID=UPI0035B44916